MNDGALLAVTIVPDAVLVDTNRFKSSLLRRDEVENERGIWPGGGERCTLVATNVDVVTLMSGTLLYTWLDATAPAIEECDSVCHGASIDMLDIS